MTVSYKPLTHTVRSRLRRSLWQSGRVQTSGKHLLHEAVVSSQTVGLKPVEDLLVAGENPNSRDYQVRYEGGVSVRDSEESALGSLRVAPCHMSTQYILDKGSVEHTDGAPNSV